MKLFKKLLCRILGHYWHIKAHQDTAISPEWLVTEARCSRCREAAPEDVLIHFKYSWRDNVQNN